MAVPELELRVLTKSDGRDVLGWHYSGPYAAYDIPADSHEEALEAFLDPANAYHVMVDASGEVWAVCCFGPDARVPGGDYQEQALDIGLGLRPDLTGLGLGSACVRTAVAHARGVPGARLLRVTIAAWNKRAQKVWERAGFRQAYRFVRSVGEPVEFVQMVLGV